MAKGVELGCQARCKLTKYEGIVVARTDWLYGCVRYGVQSEKLKEDGGLTDAQWFDEHQLERTGSGVTKETEALRSPEVRTGGPLRPNGGRQRSR